MTLEGYKEHLRGRKVYSNYGLNFPHEDMDDQMVAEATKHNRTTMFNGSVTLIDEVHVYMDSRNSASKKNRLFSYFVTQSGKLDTLLIWTSQFLGQVDKRLRLNTQTLYKAERYIVSKGKKIILRQDDKREDFFVDLHKHTFRERRGQLGFVYEKTVTLKNPRKYFGLYDTRQRVAYTGEMKDDK